MNFSASSRLEMPPGRLDFHMGAYVLGEQLHVVEGGSGFGKAGGGLDIFRAGPGHHVAQLHLLPRR